MSSAPAVELTDLDRKRRKQAEFLVHARVPWTIVGQIGVVNSELAAKVKNLMAKAAHIPRVTVEPDWYYNV